MEGAVKSRSGMFFVVCFSEDGGDRLSQWRAYGGNSGVCLKLKKAGLQNLFREGDVEVPLALQ
jgi:hypothetical protein